MPKRSSNLMMCALSSRISASHCCNCASESSALLRGSQPYALSSQSSPRTCSSLLKSIADGRKSPRFDHHSGQVSSLAEGWYGEYAQCLAGVVVAVASGTTTYGGGSTADVGGGDTNGGGVVKAVLL
nr:hypothetical protein [Tanacetum cinerariifolium]